MPSGSVEVLGQLRLVVHRSPFAVAVRHMSGEKERAPDTEGECPC